MRHSKSIKAAAAITAVGLASLCIAYLLVQSAANHNGIGEESPTPRQHIRMLSSIPAVESDAPPPQNGTFDPSSYAYLIIHYHKTGHHLSRSLRDFLVAGTPNGRPASNNRENSFQHRNHEEHTGCPQAMHLSPGIIHIQAAPDFFCDTNILVEYLLRNDNELQEKKGVKIIHLVRNPFSLAVSNWIYHTQYPTPEVWVKSIDPCTEELWYDRESLRELVTSTLLLGDDPIMRYDDFESLHEVCTERYRTNKESKKWSFYTHLRHLDPQNALALATTHMMIQGKSGGDILRMASNIVKLKQLQNLEDQIRLSQHVVAPTEPQERMIQVMTMSMEEFTQQPKEAALRFLDFALGDASPPEVKDHIASEYEKSYYGKVENGDEHITNDKEILNGQQLNIVELKEELEGYLRGHELFGRVLGNIERLVQDALRDSGSAG